MSREILSARRAACVTAVLGLLSIFPPLATDMYLAGLGDIAQSMGASHSAAELSLSIFFLGLCVGQLIMGPLIDSLGRKGPLLGATALFIVTSFALILVEDIAVFNTLRFLQALGACGGMVVGRAVVNDLYEGRRAAQAMTVLVMLLTIGPIVSPTLGSLLLGAFGWRSIFVVMLLIGALAFILSLLVVPETLPVEQRVTAPFRTGRKVAGQLLRRRAFVIPAVIAGLVQGGLFAFITGSSGVFQGVFGLSALTYGLMFAGIATALLLFGQVNTRLLNHFTAEQILKTGLPYYVAATLVLVLLSGTTTLWVFIPPLWLSIGCVGMLSANAMHIAMASARDSAGIGSAVLGAIQFGIAFTISSLVALGGSDTALPMALGLLLPAIVALILLLKFSVGAKEEAVIA
ncbi:MFS transporter, DHA1 family, bicyclomycin/chloramphenicol resistance protein [Monaibacterium marinum]|uniref:Bcr/CflA family efflux transporter n=1 Tax=Pontivivens marinum TaxID=1690039 RepID=A0A2C9CPT5_9RHOB|nr:multidrug effflux MFS transporter [Monaibacterium marinum]SOH93230.1 MFS transporter, DHA1 family, bicyclomycin/chloramphenicol resistance protein [Monaibacterium marinum]